MKLQNVLMCIAGLMLHFSTHTSSIKRNKPPVDSTTIYCKGDNKQQKFDAQQAAYAALIASKHLNKEEECTSLPGHISRTYANVLKQVKHTRRSIPQVCPNDSHESDVDTTEEDDYGWQNYDWRSLQEIRRMHHEHMLNNLKILKRAKKQYVLYQNYNPFAQWKKYNQHPPYVPSHVKLCECHGCEQLCPPGYYFFQDKYGPCADKVCVIKAYAKEIAKHYIQQQTHYHQNASLKENVERLQEIFSEKDRKAQVQEIRKHYNPHTPPAIHTIRVFNSKRFDFSHPEGYVASTWQEQPDKYDRTVQDRIRRKIQFFNDTLGAQQGPCTISRFKRAWNRKKSVHKNQAAIQAMHATDEEFLSPEEIAKYTVTPEQAINRYISQEDRDTAVKETVAAWCSLLPRIVPDLVNPLEAEEDYFKDHKNQDF